jgi:transcription elongation factor Elf1
LFLRDNLTNWQHSKIKISMIEYYFDCPHCWENQLKLIDPSAEIQNFIEDCEVCCNPLEFDIRVVNNNLESFSVIPIGQ